MAPARKRRRIPECGVEPTATLSPTDEREAGAPGASGEETASTSEAASERPTAPSRRRKPRGAWQPSRATRKRQRRARQARTQWLDVPAQHVWLPHEPVTIPQTVAGTAHERIVDFLAKMERTARWANPGVEIAQWVVEQVDRPSREKDTGMPELYARRGASAAEWTAVVATGRQELVA